MYLQPACITCVWEALCTVACHIDDMHKINNTKNKLQHKTLKRRQSWLCGSGICNLISVFKWEGSAHWKQNRLENRWKHVRRMAMVQVKGPSKLVVRLWWCWVGVHTSENTTVRQIYSPLHLNNYIEKALGNLPFLNPHDIWIFVPSSNNNLHKVIACNVIKKIFFWFITITSVFHYVFCCQGLFPL